MKENEREWKRAESGREERCGRASEGEIQVSWKAPADNGLIKLSVAQSAAKKSK